MYWPPTFNPNNVVTLSDLKYQTVEATDPRHDNYTLNATVLSPWLARADQDTRWNTGDPMARILLQGEPEGQLRSFNQDTHGTIIRLTSDLVGIQHWEVVSYFDWYVQGTATKIGAFAWCRLWTNPGDVDSEFVSGGDDDEGAVELPIGELVMLDIPAGEEVWYKFPLIGTGPYTLLVDHIGDLETTWESSGGEPGSRTAELPSAGDGFFESDDPTTDGEYKWIKFTGDPTEDTHPKLYIHVVTLEPLGGSDCSTAGLLSTGVGYGYTLAPGEILYWYIPIATAQEYSIAYSISPASGSVINCYGGDCDSSVLDLSATGDSGTLTSTGHTGPNLILVVSASPFGSNVEFNFLINLSP